MPPDFFEVIMFDINYLDKRAKASMKKAISAVCRDLRKAIDDGLMISINSQANLEDAWCEKLSVMTKVPSHYTVTINIRPRKTK